ncbi:MAG: sigma-54 dependent transcriptional regulator [Bryobacterales bacterium]
MLRRDGLPTLIAQSAAMKPALELIARVGPSDANVLITGEHGTGKEVVAQTLHQVSQRAGKPFVPLNIGGLAEGVFESEMFGHVKGAFTGADKDRMGRFELADEGTLFLDEIANITPQQQARLLRVLEAGEVERVGASKSRKIDVRILSATNADLPAMIAEGEFREDLLFRLNTVEIRLPPLRARRGHPALAAFFLEKAVRRYRKPVEGFDDSALRLLRAHPWPGNVRELDHVVQRAVLMAGGATITAADMGLAAAPTRRRAWKT